MRYEEIGSNYSNIVQWGYDDKNNLSSQTQTLNGTSYTSNYSYDNDNRLKQATTGGKSANYTYDVYSRMTGITAKRGSSTVVSTGITYKNPTSATTSTQVYKWTVGGTTYTYTYDARGNITAISDGTNTTSYVYDSLDQLTRENNQAAGKTWVYTYDNGGNILRKSEYAYTTGTLGAALDTISYGYGDSEWRDLLTSYGWKDLTSDAIGNLTNDGDWTYTWQHGRQLEQMLLPRTIDRNQEETVSFTYDAQGRRIGKHHESALLVIRPDGDYIATTTKDYSYHYLSDSLTQMTISTLGGNETLYFTYDAIGPMSVNYDGTEYYYLRNAQGDVTGLVDADGTQVVTYTYDAWGNPLSVTGSKSHTIGEDNPFRYRGYVYDTETGLYYLGSRYYNPTRGRFVNADSESLIAASLDSAAWDKNLLSYCDNNPITRVDDSGDFWHFVIGAAVGALWNGATQAICNLVEGKNWASGLGVALLAGAASGALTASGVGVIGSAIGSGMISAGSSLVSQISDGGLENVNFGEVLLDGAVGVGCGIISGAGASSVASGAGGQTQMINLGKKTASRTWSALRTNGVEAAKKEAQKATHYYMKSTKKVTDNLLGKKVRKAFGFSAFYSWDKSLFKRIFR